MDNASTAREILKGTDGVRHSDGGSAKPKLGWWLKNRLANKPPQPSSGTDVVPKLNSVRNELSGNVADRSDEPSGRSRCGGVHRQRFFEISRAYVGSLKPKPDDQEEGSSSRKPDARRVP
jgi:hypothetical protein